jgi:hypothetical protein
MKQCHMRKKEEEALVLARESSRSPLPPNGLGDTCSSRRSNGGPTPSPPPLPHPSLPQNRPMHPTPSAVSWKNVADRLLYVNGVLELVPGSGWDLASDGGEKKNDSTVLDGEAEAEAEEDEKPT